MGAIRYCLLICTFVATVFGQEKAFRVIWNTPTRSCLPKYDIGVELKKYSVEFNEKQKFYGNVINILYHNQLPLYPFIDESNNMIDGGIPQRVNASDHRLKVTAELKRKIPANYADLLIIDWEYWHPLFKSNWSSRKKYQTESRKYARDKLPDASESEIEQFATTSFEDAAKTLMLNVLRSAKTLFPKAKIGFYLFPDCRNHKETGCIAGTKESNDRLRWMFEESTALFPSLYFKGKDRKGLNCEMKQKNLWDHLKEMVRVRDSLSKRIPMYAYVSLMFGSEGDYFYDKTTLELSIKNVVNFGLEGAILWNNWSSVQSKLQCYRMRNYLRNVAGPITKGAIDQAEQCSKSKCSNKGRCYQANPTGYNMCSSVKLKSPKTTCASYNN